MADDKRIRISGGTIGIDGLGATSIISTPSDRSIKYEEKPGPFQPLDPDFAPFFTGQEARSEQLGIDLDFTIAMPSPMIENDLIILSYWANNDCDILSGLEDWTLISQLEKVWQPSVATNHHLKVYYKYAGPEEPESYVATTSTSSGNKLATTTLFRSASLLPEFVITNFSASDDTSTYHPAPSGFRSAQDQLDPLHDHSMVVFIFGISRSSPNNMLDSYVDDHAYWFGTGADNRNFYNRSYVASQYLALQTHARSMTSSLPDYGSVTMFLSVGHDSSGISLAMRGIDTGSLVAPEQSISNAAFFEEDTSGDNSRAIIGDADQTGLEPVEITLECWAYVITDNSGGQVTLIDKYESPHTANYRMHLNTNRTVLSFFAYTTSFNGWSENFTIPGGGVNLNEWNHFAVTREKSTGELRAFVNGYQIDSTVVDEVGVDMMNTTGNKPFSLGGSNNFNTDLHGYLCEARVWNYARTPQQILSNYNKTLIGTESGLAGYWPLDVNFQDQTANNNHLTAASGSSTAAPAITSIVGPF